MYFEVSFYAREMIRIQELRPCLVAQSTNGIVGEKRLNKIFAGPPLAAADSSIAETPLRKTRAGTVVGVIETADSIIMSPTFRYDF